MAVSEGSENVPDRGAPAGAGAPRRSLTLFDSTALIVGIIIGVGVYQNAPLIARGAQGCWGLAGLWILGGVLSLCGALGYAELASAYPRQGGDYVYLSRAYGPWAGFLFGWMQLAVVRPGDIAVMAFAFATYARTLYDPFAGAEPALTLRLYAAGSVALLTAVNVAGVAAGKWTQNGLMAVKIAGIVAIAAVALGSPQGSAAAGAVEPFPWSVALILVLFAYGGWNEMAYVAAEVRDSDRNIVRALALGTVAVLALYLALNGAFVYGLGYAGLAASSAVAAEVVAAAFPGAAGRLVAALVCISALGAVNGLIFTGGSRSRPARTTGRSGCWARGARRRGRPCGRCSCRARWRRGLSSRWGRSSRRFCTRRRSCICFISPPASP